MGLANAARILHAPGQLVLNPTSLLTPYPCGGTGLGIVRAITVKTGAKYTQVIAEEYGGEPVANTYEGEAWVLAAVCRDFDDDVISKVFANTAAGTVSQHKVILAPGTRRAGTKIDVDVSKLFFLPDAADAPALLFYRATLMLDESVSLTLAANNPLEVGLVFAAIRDSSTPPRMIAMGQREDIAFP